MNFLDAQEDARRRTGLLLVYFAMALLAYAVVATAAVLLAFAVFAPFALPRMEMVASWWQVAATAATCTVLAISLATWSALRRLARGGGDAVAEMLGGEVVRSGTDDPALRQLHNVVEEMSLAAGIASPMLYLLANEPGANAFAAGHRRDFAVIGVTRGLLDLLDRDELQAVVAHEMAHIRNGDMLLHMRLMGVIAGLMILRVLGGRLITLGSAMKVGDDGVPRRELALPSLAGGGVLWLAGWLGATLGAIVKAAICRQREYLADAAAVQFTRHPQALASALKKIGARHFGAQMLHPNALLMSHMLFHDARSSWLGRLLATHPPLEERIRRVDPHWDGVWPEPPPLAGDAAMLALARGWLGQGLLATLPRLHGPTPSSLEAPDPRQSTLRVLMATLPRSPGAAPEGPEQNRPSGEGLVDEVEAQAGTLWLLLSHDDTARRDQRRLLDGRLPQAVLDALDRREAEGRTMSAVARWELARRLALPTRRLEAFRARRLLECMDLLIDHDGRVSLEEWAIRVLTRRRTGARFHTPPGLLSSARELETVTEAAGVLLSMLAWVGASGASAQSQAEAAFARGRQRLGLPGLALSPRRSLSMSRLDAALDVLELLRPGHRRRVLEAAQSCARADTVVSPREEWFLTVLADLLDIPPGA